MVWFEEASVEMESYTHVRLISSKIDFEYDSHHIAWAASVLTSGAIKTHHREHSDLHQELELNRVREGV